MLPNQETDNPLSSPRTRLKTKSDTTVTKMKAFKHCLFVTPGTFRIFRFRGFPCFPMCVIYKQAKQGDARTSLPRHPSETATGTYSSGLRRRPILPSSPDRSSSPTCCSAAGGQAPPMGECFVIFPTGGVS